MTFVEKLGREFVITGEVEPDYQHPEAFLEKAKKYKLYTNTLNVIDSPVGLFQPSSLAVSAILAKEGYDPVFQTTCRDKNKVAIINELLGAKLLGIENVLAITGDYPQHGGKPVYEFDSTSLLRLIKQEMPKEFKGFKMNVGAGYNPLCEPNEPELIKLEKKLKYADFIQTQLVFEPSQLEHEILQKHKKKIIVGIFPLAPGLAEYFDKEIPGVVVPKNVKEAIKSLNDGIDLARELVGYVKDAGFAGVHLMTFGKAEDRIGEILSDVVPK